MPTVTSTVESYYRSIVDQLSVDERLPSERAVVAELNTCRTTIRLVLTKLKAEGLVYAVPGSGHYKK